MVTIDTKTAEGLLELYRNVESADAVYKRCQSDQFRLHVKAVMQNDSVKQAFEQLREKTEHSQITAEGQQIGTASKSAQKGRRSAANES